MKKSIFLFGPFIGSLSWEFYRFSPYAIFTKKIYPRIPIAVLTRPERFDLYGQYADFLVPLKIKNDNTKDQICFKLKNFDESEYNKLIQRFRFMYEKRFNIEDHYYPDITDYRFKIRWQFPRFKMNYDFCPRNRNFENVRLFLPRKSFVLVTPPYDNDLMNKISLCVSKNKLNKKYQFLTCGKYDSVFKSINEIPIDKETTKIGYIIEILKLSKLVIGPKSDLIYLSLLLRCPVISWGSYIGLDLLNPLKTPITVYNKIPYDLISEELTQKLIKKKDRTEYNRF